jgi:Bacterial Ig-like domain (group 2)/Abnormal spindle-like microcephaly-assoc'd, ASPM-SPD-2-Hydin
MRKLIFVISSLLVAVQLSSAQSAGVSPLSVSFSFVVAGTTSAPRLVTLTNTGTATLIVSGVSASANFAQTNNCTRLAPKAKCTISVTFSPAARQHYTGTLTISDNASATTQTVALQGTGVAPVVMSATSLAFGQVAVGTTSAVKTSILTNYQTKALNISSVGITGPFNLDPSTTCAGQVAARGKCTLAVTYKPTAATLQTGVVTIAHDASNSPTTVNVRGTGVARKLTSISVTPGTASISAGSTQQFTATGTFSDGSTADITSTVVWASSATGVATINAKGLSTGVASGTSTISAAQAGVTGTATLTITTAGLAVPTQFRVDISVGTTGQLFVSWVPVGNASFYNVERSTQPSSGFTLVTQCSGTGGKAFTGTFQNLRVCRDKGLTVGTSYSYRVQACNATACGGFTTVTSNVPVKSDCTAAQMPDLSGVKELNSIQLKSSTVDPAVTYLPTNSQFAGYPTPGTVRRNKLVVFLSGSGGSCGGVGVIGHVGMDLGFDAMCVDYSNAATAINICAGDTSCFANVFQSKLDATGPCSIANGPHCGFDPTTGQPYVNSNPADAITQRITKMLEYLDANGFNANGTVWSSYLTNGSPDWSRIILSGWSQGGSLSTYTAYKLPIARAINISAPPLATVVGGVMTAADFFSDPPATNIRNIYGLVHTRDPLYTTGRFRAVWNAAGLTSLNNDAEVQLNTSTPVGLNCNLGTPSHNFSTSAVDGPFGPHDDTNALWNEDVLKYMLID